MGSWMDGPRRMLGKSIEYRGLISRLTGMMSHDQAEVAGEAPAPVGPRRIVGGTAAPELCMLASNSVFVPFEGKRVTQLKADGINAMYLDGTTIAGREGGPLDCALHCVPGLRRLENAFGHPMVFFGEYVAHDGFNATLGEHKAGRGDGVFWLYDAMPHGAWVTGKDYLVPIEERLAALRATFSLMQPGLFVGMLDWWMLDHAETVAKAREIWAAGFEGVVSKEAGSPLVRRRDGAWIKVKERFEAPCALIDTIHRNNKLRSIIVRGPEPSGSKPITLTGGWTDSEAESMDIGMAEGSQGRIIAVEFELTTGATRSIRGASFKGLIA